MSSKFHYFGFGSNMLKKRIQIQNPTAVRIGAGKLENYRLDFHTTSNTWLGAPATIVPTKDAQVFGSIWEIDECNLKDLDNQEGVHDGIYVATTLPILMLNTGKFINCRVYYLNNQPHVDIRLVKNTEDIPSDRKPSKTYLKTLVKGALETGIPMDYVAWLQSYRHNNVQVEEMEQKLELQEVKLCETD